jgi:CrcB protein
MLTSQVVAYLLNDHIIAASTYFLFELGAWFVIEVLLVGLGGAIGAIGRYLTGLLASKISIGIEFPLGTLAVNVLGCFLAGVLVGLSSGPVSSRYLSESARLFLMTGILGGYTTFSALGIETFLLLKRGQVGVACLVVGLNIAIGLLLIALGFRIASQ